MSRLVSVLFLLTFVSAPPLVHASAKRSWFCDWALRPFSWREKAQETKAPPLEPKSEDATAPPQPEAPPEPVEPHQPQRSPELRLTALARQQAEDQNISEADLLSILSASPKIFPRGGRDLFATYLPLRGVEHPAIELNLRRTIEFWQPPRQRRFIIRKINPPFELTTQARIDLNRIKLTPLAFENLLTRLQKPPVRSIDHWEIEIPRKGHHSLHVLYVSSNQKAHIYRVTEVLPDKPKINTYRIKETPVEVQGVWMTESAKMQWQSAPFEIERALDGMSNLKPTESGESHRFTFSGHPDRRFTIEFAEDDLYGIVILKISHSDKKQEQPTPQSPLPFVMFPITERALTHWGMAVEDLVALFQNRKETPRPIGENDLGLDPTREIFVSTTSRPIKKASLARRFEVITSSTVNGHKPVVLSIRLAPAEPRPTQAVAVSAEKSPQKPALPKDAPIPFPELNAIAISLLQSQELAHKNPLLIADLANLIKMSQEFYNNLKLLSHHPDMRELIEEENSALEQRMAMHVEDIAARISENDRNEISEVLLDIQPEDASPWSKSFAFELQNSYERYARSQNWTVEDLATSNGAAASNSRLLRIRGRKAWNYMRFEEGLQRQILRAPNDRRSSRQSSHTARASITVLKGPVLPQEIRSSLGSKRATQSLQFIRSYHLPSNRLTDERVDRIAIEPSDALKLGNLEPLHRQIEYQTLVSYLRDLVGN